MPSLFESRFSAPYSLTSVSLAILVSVLVAVLSRLLFAGPFRSSQALWNKCRPRNNPRWKSSRPGL